MPAYADVSGASPITDYEIGDDWISVSFATKKRRQGRTYLYTAASCGGDTVTSMVDLALIGQGLATYIARERPGYARRS